MIQVIGLGAGGHAKVVMDILRLDGGYQVIGLLDPERSLWQTKVSGVSVLGNDDLLPELLDRGVRHAFVGLGAVGDTGPRQRLYWTARDHGLEIVPAIHRQAWVSSSAHIGNGPTIMAGAVVNAEARIGDNVIINTGATVEHDCVVGDHAHVATGARLAGAVYVGQGAHVGLGACVLQSVRVGANAVVGAGAVVLDNVPDGVTVAGVPARILQQGIG